MPVASVNVAVAGRKLLLASLHPRRLIRSSPSLRSNIMDLAERKRLLDERIKRGSMDLREGADSFLQDRIVNPLYNAGFENLGPALGAAGSAAIEYVTPESTTDIALSLNPMGKMAGKMGGVAERAGKVLSPRQRENVIEALKVKFPGDAVSQSKALAQVERSSMETFEATQHMVKGAKNDAAISAVTSPRVSPPVTVRAANSPPPVAPVQTARSDSGLIDERQAELLRRRAAQGL